MEPTFGRCVLVAAFTWVGCGATATNESGNHDSGGVCTAACDTPLDLSAPPDLAVASDMTPPADLAAVRDLTPSPPCDPVLQTNCPSGKACVAASGEETLCVTPGNVATGGACTSSANCVAGDGCIGGPIDYQCHRYCSLDEDCRASSSNQPPDSSQTPAYCLGIGNSSSHACSIPCNPVSSLGASGCGAGKCDVYSRVAGGPEFSDCGGRGTSAEGAPCAGDLDCDEGMGCFLTNTGAKCRRYCRMGTNADCLGQFCYDVADWTLFGVCCPAAGC